MVKQKPAKYSSSKIVLSTKNYMHKEFPCLESAPKFQNIPFINVKWHFARKMFYENRYRVIEGNTLVLLLFDFLHESLIAIMFCASWIECYVSPTKIKEDILWTISLDLNYFSHVVVFFLTKVDPFYSTAIEYFLPTTMVLVW